MGLEIEVAAAAAKSALSRGEAAVLLGVMIGGSLLAGIIIAVARDFQQRRRTAETGGETLSVIRSWLALTLVLGLLATCAAAFEVDDPQLRNTLLGGLVASTGAAVAFYFSSKGADTARADILNTTKALAQTVTAPTRFSAADPPAATKDAPYTPYHFVADGTPPVIYRVGSGKLPAGVDLDLDGQLHGTPTEAGDFGFSVIAANSMGSKASDPIQLQVQQP